MNSKVLDLDFGKHDQGLRGNRIRQALEFLSQHYDIRINKFKLSEKEIHSKTKKYTFPPSLDDISLHMQEEEIQLSDATLRKIINSPNQIKTYNPIKEYFESIENTFKGSSHIDKLCTLITAIDYKDKEEGYYQIRMINLVKKWFVAAVACGLEVHQNEVNLGFIQEEEGTGKTSICQYIVPDPLQMMFIKSDREKNGFNMRTAFTENFIILFDEMIGLNQFTAETFKSTMSATDIDVKERHDPFPRRKPRIGNAMFTTNNKTGKNKGFLYPGLGTRRFGCIHLEAIDLDRIYEEVDVNQIWAEAHTLFKGGYEYKFGPADFKEFLDYNVRFMVETNAVQIIEANFAKPLNGAGHWLRPTDILLMLKDKKMASREVLNELSPEKIGAALKQLGFDKTPKRINGEPSYPYHVAFLF